MITTIEKKIWGLKYTEEYDPELGMVWCPKIKAPFYFNGKMVVGLNEKFLLKAIDEGIKVFMVKVDDRNIPIDVPDKRILNKMRKEKRCEEIKSLFKGGKPMRIYYFSI